MARIEINMTCGCGEVFRSVPEAEDGGTRSGFNAGKAVSAAMKHVDNTGHTLDTLGSIKITPSESRVQTEELEEKYGETYKPDSPRPHDKKPKQRSHPHRRVLHEKRRETVR